MQTDKIKLLASYGTAVLVIIGGLIMLFISRGEGATDFQLVLASFIGAAISFLFGQESATRATRAAERAASFGTTVTK